MQTNRNESDSWNEYRLLVLAELERLNECVERLRTQDVNSLRECRQEITKISRSLSEKVQRLADTSDSEIKSVKDRLNTLEQTGVFQDYTERTKNHWAIWAAVISIVVTLITSIVSLILSIQ